LEFRHPRRYQQKQLEAGLTANFLSAIGAQSIPSWNQIITWLKEMETLRTAAA